MNRGLATPRNDKAGKPYDLEITSKTQKGDTLQLICKFSHAGKNQSISVVTKKGVMDSVTSGEKAELPELHLEANWTE